MATFNVNRSVDDPFYRYKMPRLIAKVEGKGNGIKTVIVNMPEVAKALARPPTYPTKYFGCELGAQTMMDAKNERYIVNGSHDQTKLQDLLDGFIKRFVLCPECENPETNLNVLEKKGMIRQRCIACGYQGNIDMRHRLTTFITKNPPDMDPTATPSKKDKRAKKGKNKEGVNGDSKEAGSPENGSNNINSGTGNIEVDVAHGTLSVHAPDVKAYQDDDEDWGEDTSEEARKKRMEDLTSAAKGLTMSDDLEKTQQERLTLFYALVKERKENGTLVNADKEILSEADRLDVKDKGVLVLTELLFDENITKQVQTYKRHFLRLCHENHKAQKYLLGGVELLVGNVHKDTLMSKVPNILKALYDADILEEEIILDWSKKVSKKYVDKETCKEIHAKAAPLIKWLEEAEEEESSEEEEEIEVDFSHTKKVGVTTVTTAKESTPKSDKVEEPEDDFDIDAI